MTTAKEIRETFKEVFFSELDGLKKIVEEEDDIPTNLVKKLSLCLMNVAGAMIDASVQNLPSKERKEMSTKMACLFCECFKADFLNRMEAVHANAEKGVVVIGNLEVKA